MKPSDIEGTLDSSRFRITDAAYGVTMAIDECAACGFRQCSDAEMVVSQYEAMVDDEYEAGSRARAVQAERLIQAALGGRSPSGLRLLDVGAGSGLLVEKAIAIGIDAEGVEPSRGLCKHAMARGVRLHQGILPHADVHPPYDLIMVVDVIEHVNDPVGLMTEVSRLLSETGVGLVVTPDASSMAAQLMRWRWWHYRVAHIGYFNRATLSSALERAGLVPKRWFRPTWHFPLDYLLERARVYIPGRPKLKLPGNMSSWVIPLNLLDSIAVVFDKGNAR